MPVSYTHLDVYKRQTLYFTNLEENICGFIQVLYSKVMGGIYKGFQLNFKMFNAIEVEGAEKTNIWESVKIDNVKEFEKFKLVSKMVNFQILPYENEENSEIIAQLLINVDLPSGSTTTNLRADFKVDLYQGYKLYPDGTSYFLDKSVRKNENTDGITSKRLLRHVFVPRGQGFGTISYIDKKTKKSYDFDFAGVPVCYLDALQGLVPNKAASRWNFMTFQGPSYSVLCLEYTTTASYNHQKVTMWSISKDKKIVSIGSQLNNDSIIKFNSTIKDPENGWSFPQSIEFNFSDMPLYRWSEDKLHLVNRYDILGELPQIVKNIASEIEGVRPYLCLLYTSRCV